jgi:hypothetical protein
MADRPGASLRELQMIVGGSRSNISERLGRFHAQGFAEGPRCCPTRHWALTEAGLKRADEAELLTPVDLNGRPVEPWLKPEAVMASRSRDVTECFRTSGIYALNVAQKRAGAAKRRVAAE